MSLLSYERTDPGSLGKLFKFQPDFMYRSTSVEESPFDILGKPLPKVPVSKSAPYSTYKSIILRPFEWLA